jgi:hypothetical protein
MFSFIQGKITIIMLGPSQQAPRFLVPFGVLHLSQKEDAKFT